jgi:membrane-bound lytic murein transglycosylase MltF
MGVNPNLAVSMAAVESSFNPSAISSSGATGLGQFTRGAWLDRIKEQSIRVKSFAKTFRKTAIGISG